MRILATFLLLALTASELTAQTWTNPTPQMLAMSNAVAFQSTAPMLHLGWSWDATNYPTGEPTNVFAVIQENDDLTTSNWSTVWANYGTNAFVFATNQTCGFFRATATYSTQ